MSKSRPFHKESRARSLVKGLTWRILASTDTFLISMWRTKDGEKSLYLVLTEIVTKFVLYYFHERMWNHMLKDRTHTPLTSLLKTLSWRLVGTVDTMLLAWYFFGDPLIGIQIASIELVTKMILYYLHERLWERVPLGTVRKYLPFIKVTGEKDEES